MWEMREACAGESNGGKLKITITEQQLIKIIKYNTKIYLRNLDLYFCVFQYLLNMVIQTKHI